MAPTIYEWIYLKLERIIGNPLRLPMHMRFEASGFMDLSMDKLYADGASVTIALSHYFRQNGDMIPDPDMVIRIYPAMKMAEALTYQDCFGFRMVYPTPDQVNFRAKKDLNVFLSRWLSNILDQGFERRLGDTHGF